MTPEHRMHHELSRHGSTIRTLTPLDQRIPPWDPHAFRRRRCPFCAGNGISRFRRPDQLTVNSCNRCGSYFVSPAPNERQLEKFYREYFFIHRHEELRRHLTDTALTREMKSLDPWTDRKANVLASIMPMRGRRVLDVGFGWGQQMLLFRVLGADISGIDIDRNVVDFAERTLGFNTVRCCALEDLPRSDRYDLITLHDLIEHPLHPKSMLRHALQHLAPSGLLSLWTPNASFVATDEDPILFRVDLEHLQYLTVQTCNYIASRFHLEIVHLEATGSPVLEQIERLSGRFSLELRTKMMLRRTFRNLPGFTQLNAFRHRLLSSPQRRGTYHLFCVLRRR